LKPGCNERMSPGLHRPRIQIKTAADWLSLIRLLLAPVLWFLAIGRHPKAVGVGIAVSGASDVLDGVVARRSARRSQFGKQLDTAADLAVILSAPGWMALLCPSAFRRRSRPLLALAVPGAALLAYEWKRFRRLGALHIDSARAGAIIAHLYVLNLFVRGRDSNALFNGFLALAASAAGETAYILLTRDDVETLSSRPLISDALRSIHRAKN
jgi:CDP-alcohol phosphatidyltransferase